ncbi:alpha/beta fold hydrolase [Mesobacterium pallidum]|uniref:alpha/beta fold hydrolase n=1 Tax=Mesobacterium pallidum TaxID=2872037 RepID=UPI001EE2EDA7|nr:alpha/beta hydrolase [Mesobacterium pallidum]
MATTLLIPGLLCDAIVWESVLAHIPLAQVADLSTQDRIGQMAQDCLDRTPGQLRVAGHSMGARVAIEMLRRAPERIERVALLDTGIHPLKKDEREKRAEIVAYAHANGMEALAKRWLPPMVWEGNQQNPELMGRLTDMVLSKDPDLHERQIHALVTRPDTDHLREVRCPALILVGREDQWSPVSQHEDIAAMMPQAQLVVIDEAGHFAPMERPEQVDAVLVPFLTAES